MKYTSQDRTSLTPLSLQNEHSRRERREGRRPRRNAAANVPYGGSGRGSQNPAASSTGSSRTSSAGSYRQAQRTWTGPAQRVEYNPENGMLFFVAPPAEGEEHVRNLQNAYGGRITVNQQNAYVYQWCLRRGGGQAGRGALTAATSEQSRQLWSARNAWVESHRSRPRGRETVWVGVNPNGSYVL